MEVLIKPQIPRSKTFIGKRYCLSQWFGALPVLRSQYDKIQRGPMKNRFSDCLDTFRPQSIYMTPCSNSSLSVLLCICSISVKCVQSLLLNNSFHDGPFVGTVGVQLFSNSTSPTRNKPFSTALQISASSSLLTL